MNEREQTLEYLLVELLSYFQSGEEGNSTFEGGRAILDVEVSDEVEALLDQTEIILDNSREGDE